MWGPEIDTHDSIFGWGFESCNFEAKITQYSPIIFYFSKMMNFKLYSNLKTCFQPRIKAEDTQHNDISVTKRTNEKLPNLLFSIILSSSLPVYDLYQKLRVWWTFWPSSAQSSPIMLKNIFHLNKVDRYKSKEHEKLRRKDPSFNTLICT